MIKNPVTLVKVWLNKRISRAVRRELNTIFRRDGSISVDHHMMSDSWAVIKVDVGDTCYLKFITMDKVDLRELQQFLRRYERSRVDSTPDVMRMLNSRLFEI